MAMAFATARKAIQISSYCKHIWHGAELHTCRAALAGSFCTNQDVCTRHAHLIWLGTAKHKTFRSKNKQLLHLAKRTHANHCHGYGDSHSQEGNTHFFVLQADLAWCRMHTCRTALAGSFCTNQDKCMQTAIPM